MHLKVKYVKPVNGAIITSLNGGVAPHPSFFKKPTYFVYDLDDPTFAKFMPALQFHQQFRFKFPDDPLDTEIERKDNA